MRRGEEGGEVVDQVDKANIYNLHEMTAIIQSLMDAFVTGNVASPFDCHHHHHCAQTICIYMSINNHDLFSETNC